MELGGVAVVVVVVGGGLRGGAAIDRSPLITGEGYSKSTRWTGLERHKLNYDMRNESRG